MISNVENQQQQFVSLPRALFENQAKRAGDQRSGTTPTIEEIEDAVNYLISLHNWKQKKRNNSFWARCLSCFGLQRKPLKGKHIDQILNSLKRGVIPKELTLIVSMRKWEKKRTSIENSDNPAPLSLQADLRIKSEQIPLSTEKQATRQQSNKTQRSVNRTLSSVTRNKHNVNISMAGSEMVETPILASSRNEADETREASGQLLQMERYKQGTLIMKADGLNFKEISFVNKSCVVKFITLTLMFTVLVFYAFRCN